jgi:hypothetical protein
MDIHARKTGRLGKRPHPDARQARRAAPSKGLAPTTLNPAPHRPERPPQAVFSFFKNLSRKKCCAKLGHFCAKLVRFCANLPASKIL